jgi:putative endonuclease
MSPAPTPRTARGRTGIAAEAVARRYLEDSGWIILAANLVVGQGELDLVALDPATPRTIVVVEVRGRRSPRFGAPEESVDRAKLARIQAAAFRLLRSGWREGMGLQGARTLRIDVIAVDLDPATVRIAGRPALRHLRGVTG